MLDQTPVQIAWVTRDLDATEKALTTLLGAKKWVRIPSVHFAPDTCTFRGRPADFVAHISLSYAGDTQLEVIAPVSGESIYTEFLDRVGPGLHHICVEAPDTDADAPIIGATACSWVTRCASAPAAAVTVMKAKNLTAPKRRANALPNGNSHSTLKARWLRLACSSE